MESPQKLFLESFNVTTEEWGTISKFIKIITLKKGDFFIEEGKICRNSGFIMNGVMRYFSYDKDGNDPTCYFISEKGYILDPFTFNKQTPSGINCQAVTPCKIAAISFEANIKLLAELPGWGDLTTRLILDISFNFANQKEMLSMNASKRYAYFCEKYREIAERVPLQYVASYLGIKQPSLSRVRKKRI